MSNEEIGNKCVDTPLGEIVSLDWTVGVEDSQTSRVTGPPVPEVGGGTERPGSLDGDRRMEVSTGDNRRRPVKRFTR